MANTKEFPQVPGDRSDHGERRDLLALRLTPGLGPVLIRRLLDRFGSAGHARAAEPAQLRTVPGIGDARARQLARDHRAIDARVRDECKALRNVGGRAVTWADHEYPNLLRSIPDAPPVLFVRGSLAHLRFPVGIVGARKCTAYGLDQAGRFAGHLARSKLSIVSGGARGIDTAAHRAARQADGHTVAVLGCGLGHCYPPENADLFEHLAEHAEHGAVVTELTTDTPPTAENFPARNRLISGMSLGVLVVEAGTRSGALITARLAVEEHNREVMAIPGRTTDASSEGTNELLRSGGAALVTHPAHVLEQIESQARHLHAGTHADRFGAPRFSPDRSSEPSPAEAPASPAEPVHLPETQLLIWRALRSGPADLDQLTASLGRPAHELLAELTALELDRRVRRVGPSFEAV